MTLRSWIRKLFASRGMFGLTPSDFKALYQDLLGRTPNDIEVANQVAELKKVGQQSLALTFLQSTEYRLDVVAGYITNT